MRSVAAVDIIMFCSSAQAPTLELNRHNALRPPLPAHRRNAQISGALPITSSASDFASATHRDSRRRPRGACRGGSSAARRPVRPAPGIARRRAEPERAASSLGNARTPHETYGGLELRSPTSSRCTPSRLLNTDARPRKAERNAAPIGGRRAPRRWAAGWIHSDAHRLRDLQHLWRKWLSSRSSTIADSRNSRRDEAPRRRERAREDRALTPLVSRARRARALGLPILQLGGQAGHRRGQPRLRLLEHRRGAPHRRRGAGGIACRIARSPRAAGDRVHLASLPRPAVRRAVGLRLPDVPRRGPPRRRRRGRGGRRERAAHWPRRRATSARCGRRGSRR